MNLSPLPVLVILLFVASVGSSQTTLYVPSGTVGTSSSGNVGIGVSAPGALLTVGQIGTADNGTAEFFDHPNLYTAGSGGTLYGQALIQSVGNASSQAGQTSALILSQQVVSSATSPSRLGMYLDVYDTPANTYGINLRGFVSTVNHLGSGNASAVLGNLATVSNYATTAQLVGTRTNLINAAAGSINGVTTAAVEYDANFSNLGANSTVATYKGVSINDITNQGTITNTYGVYVGNLTQGTQTNTPYAVYASDGNATSYFAGPFRVGGTPSNSPTTKFTVDAWWWTYNGNPLDQGEGRVMNVGAMAFNDTGPAGTRPNLALATFNYNGNGVTATNPITINDAAIVEIGQGNGTQFATGTIGNVTISNSWGLLNRFNLRSDGMTWLGGGGGNMQATGLNGAQVQVRSAIFGDASTPAGGTANSVVFTSFGQPLLGATNTGVTTTNAATVYIAGAPGLWGSNETIVNSWGLWNGGASRLDGNVVIGSTTASSSALTGALVVSGGVGIQGNLNVAGAFTANNFTFGDTTLTGKLKLAAGSATLAPLTLQAGTNLSTPTFGAVEFDGTNLFVTNNAASPTRKTLAYAAATLTGYGITDGVSTSGTYGDPSWLTSLSAAKLTTGTLPASAMPAHTGDVTSSAGSTALTLAASGVTAGTYSKVTVDAKGRVTTGAALATGDVTTALGYTPYNATTNSAGFIASSGAPVQSVFGRTGTVALATADITTALAGGNLGVGNTAPNYKVDITGDLSVDSGYNTGAANLYLSHMPSLAGQHKAAIIAPSSGQFGRSTGLFFALNSVNDNTNATTSDAKLTILEGGNIGVGNMAPNYKVDISGDLSVDSGTNTGTANLYLSHMPVQAGQHKTAIIAPSGGQYGRSTGLFFALNSVNDYTNATTSDAKLTILEGGNVGIGTSSPAQKLDVAGTIRGQNVQVTGITSATLLGTDSSGNLVSTAPSSLQLTNGQVVTALGYAPVSTTPGTPYSDPTWLGSLSAAKLTTGTLPVSAMPAHTGDVTSSAGSTALTLAASGVTAGTYSKVTVDAKGRVTTGAALASGDVTTALTYTPVASTGGTFTGNVKLAAGTTTVAPLTLQTGTNLSTPVFGAMEFDGTNLFVTNNSASPTRKTLAYAAATLTGYGITDGVSTSSTYGDPSWLTSLSATKLTTGTLPASAMPAHTGDVTSSAGSTALTLAASGVTAGTYSKVTVDAKGRVTTGVALASGDVTTALGYTPYNATTNQAGYIAASGAPVQSVFGRTGAVALTATDVNTALASASLGIGTTNPGQKLDIVGNGTDTFVHIGSSGRDKGIIIQRDNWGNEFLRIAGAADGTGVTGQNNLYLFDRIAPSSPNMRSIQFRHSNDGGATFANDMTIDAAGNLGIGTTAPGALLDVNGSIRGNTLQLNQSALKGVLLSTDSSGNLQAATLTSAQLAPALSGSALTPASVTATSLTANGAVTGNSIAATNLKTTSGTAVVAADTNGNLVQATAASFGTLLDGRYVQSNNGTFTGTVTGDSLTAKNLAVTGGTPVVGTDGNGKLVAATASTIGALLDGRYIQQSGGTVSGATTFSGGLSASSMSVTGNVGIGTNSPGSKLDIVGTSLYTWDVSGQLNIRDSANAQKILDLGYDGTANVGFIQSIWSGSTRTPLALQPNGGNVGIGTTTTYGLLTVGSGNAAWTIGSGDPTTGAWLRNDGSNPVISTNIGHMYYGYQGNVKNLFFMGGGTTPQLTVVGSTGNVGIGTISPTARLDVNNSVVNNSPFQNLAVVGADGNVENPVGTYSDSNPSWGIGFTRDWSGQGNRSLGAGIYSYGTPGWGQGLVLRTSPGGGVNPTNYTRLVITDTGNVGIGTTAPGVMLDVNGTIRAQYLTLQNAPKGTLLATNGNGDIVGSGSTSIAMTGFNADNTASSGGYFRYNGFGDVTLGYPARGTTGGRAMVADVSNALTLNYAGDFSGGLNVATNIHFGNTGATSWITSSNLGIGTTTPLAGLSVIYPQDGQPAGANASGNGNWYDPVNYAAYIHNNANAQSRYGLLVSDYFRNWENYVFAVDGRLYGTGGSTDGGTIALDQHTPYFVVRGDGAVGINTLNLGPNGTNYKLSVGGAIHATDIVVETGWADYVFDKDHKLQDLDSVEKHIKEEKRLPDMPSAKEVAEHGVNVGQMEAKLLAKVEELTLYMIDLKKESSDLKKENTELRAELDDLRKRIQ